MGRLLTTVAHLLRAERSAPNPTSRARMMYLRDIAQETPAHAQTPCDLAAFGERSLELTGDPDKFTVPGWPGTSAVREATDLYKASPASVEAVLDELLADSAAEVIFYNYLLMLNTNFLIRKLHYNMPNCI